MLRLAASFFAILILAGAACAQVVIPNFWDDGERVARPDLSGVTRIRFLTTVDFPPFNSVDGNGQLIGFNVDLARAICARLEVLPICQIQAVPWDELEGALRSGEGEAAIAGLAITAEARRTLAFTRAYLRFPARFAVARSFDEEAGIDAAIAGKRIGAVGGSAHLALLREAFPAARTVTYTRSEWMLKDLAAGKLDGVFSDGMRLSLWLAGRDGAACCRFAGGPYLDPAYLGEGLAIAVSHDNALLVEAFDWALREMSFDGGFADIYLRHFPVSFY
jgi:polar amino acid transport system substrate-binding protein